MKSIVSWTLFCLFSLLVITSCQKENIDTVVETEETISPTTTTVAPPANALLGRSSTSSQSTAETEGLSFDCFEIIFPFNLVDSEGGIHEVADETAFTELLSEDGDTSVYMVDFIYPISVRLNEEISEITDSEQLGELFAECIPDGGWDEFIFPAYLIDDENSCYKTVYPISLEDLNGNIITVADEAAFIEVLVEKEVYFHFPINLTDGEAVVSIANVDELFTTLFSCNEYYEDSTAWDWEGGFEYIGCFQVNFPMTVVVADGGEKVVNNHEELCELMLQGELVDYVYPLTLTGPEGAQIIANSAEELDGILEQCYEGPWNPGEGGNPESDLFLLAIFSQPFGEDSTSVCYTINYPISGVLIDEDGNTQTTTFNSFVDIFTFQPVEGIEDSSIVELVYPVDVVLQSDGQVRTLNDTEDLYEIMEECNEGL